MAGAWYADVLGGRAGAVCFAAMTVLALSTPGGASATAQEAIEETVQVIDGIRLEVRKNPKLPVKGKYLVALNYVPAVNERRPPYTAVLMTLDGDGRIDVLQKFTSPDVPILATDLRPQPSGPYTFVLTKIHVPVWKYDIRSLDPRTGAEIIEPKDAPTGDLGQDLHETIVPVGQRRLGLAYRVRKDGDTTYLDMEVTAVSAKTGDVVGQWTSRNQFPAEMTGDYLHFNSLFPLSEDRVLASARSTNTLYVINLTTGRIEDQLDPTSWAVLDDPQNGFARQHFAHFRENGNLVLFDNRDGSEPHPRSRAVEYAVDWKARTLKLVWEHRAEDSMPFRYGWGSARMIGQDQVLIGWGDYPRAKGFCEGRTGSFPVFSHMTRDKAPVFELRAPCGWATYRVYFVPEGPKG